MTHSPQVLLLGSGEFGADLVTSFQRLGATVTAVDGHAHSPAQRLADRAAVLDLTDSAALSAAIERFEPDYVVPATQMVATDALAVAERGRAQVVPSARSALLTLDREGLRRLAADELGLPTVPFWFAGSPPELAAVAEHAGYPLVVKPLVGSQIEGQSVLLRAEDVEPAWRRAVGQFGHARVLAESVVEIDCEITVLVMRADEHTSGSAAPQFCEPIGHRRIDRVLEAWQPYPLSSAARDSVRSIAARVTGALGGRGLFGVELLVRDDEVYFSDVTAVPHESALVTLRAQRLSVFDLYARTVLGLPVDPVMVSPGAAQISSAEPRRSGLAELAKSLSVPETDVRVLPSTGPGAVGRTLVLATAPEVAEARERVQRASAVWRATGPVGGARTTEQVAPERSEQ